MQAAGSWAQRWPVSWSHKSEGVQGRSPEVGIHCPGVTQTGDRQAQNMPSPSLSHSCVAISVSWP